MGIELVQTARTRALALMRERDGMEAEMEAISSALTRPGGPGLSGNLVDAEGFPRADVDIPNVRAQRNRLAVLQTDRAVVTAKIEALLHEALAPTRDGLEGPQTAADAPRPPSGASSSPSATTTATMTTTTTTTAAGNGTISPPADGHQPRGAPAVGSSGAAVSGSAPAAHAAHGRNAAPPVGTRIIQQAFALVDQVSENSPASAAGILVGDEFLVVGAISVRALGSPNAAMQALPGFVREHENREVELSVARVVAPSGERQQVELILTPRRWSGQGLLGCHVVPAPMREDIFVAQVATLAAEHASAERLSHGFQGHYAE